MNKVYETEKLKLEFNYELAQLKEKSTGKILMKDTFYGNPKCGIIGTNNNWAIIAGIHLVLWKPNETKKYQTESFQWIQALRIKNEKQVEVLIDPWSEKSSIWELNIETTKLIKIKDFTDYRNTEYTECVEW